MDDEDNETLEEYMERTMSEDDREIYREPVTLGPDIIAYRRTRGLPV